MAYAQSRSMNDELNAGMTDGKYKKVHQNWAPVVFDASYTERADLDDVWYGIHEKQVKVAPDALAQATPEFVRTPKSNLNQV